MLMPGALTRATISPHISAGEPWAAGDVWLFRQAWLPSGIPTPAGFTTLKENCHVAGIPTAASHRRAMSLSCRKLSLWQSQILSTRRQRQEGRRKKPKAAKKAK